MEQYILLPDSGHYNVLQLFLCKEPCMEFKPAKGISHGEIFKEILEEKKILFKSRKADEFPEPIGKLYELVGAGFAIIDKDDGGKHVLYFSGYSDHYKMGINEKHIENWKRYHNVQNLNTIVEESDIVF